MKVGVKKGYKQTQEHRMHLSQVHMGHQFSIEHRNNISKALTGKKHTEEHRRKTTGINNGMFGRTGERSSMFGKGYKVSGSKNAWFGKTGSNHPTWNSHFEQWVKDKIRRAISGEKNGMFGKKGDKHPTWKGGKSFEPYTNEWTDELKIDIMGRNNNKCQICGNNGKLLVHHINYDKKNCSLSNLISLCRKCHTKTNFNREYWEQLFFHNNKLAAQIDQEIIGGMK